MKPCTTWYEMRLKFSQEHIANIVYNRSKIRALYPIAGTAGKN